jgi:glycosyltransferase involved in cell wall biosynthesis
VTTLSARVPVTAVVLTFNEGRNLPACLDSLTGWVDRIVVVDSGSTDDTVAVARERGAIVLAHPFTSHAAQWQWALDSLELDASAPWVLGLDADQRVTSALRDSIITALSEPDGARDVVAYYVNRRQIFRGRWIRYGGYYPKHLLKLFRIDAVRVDPADLVDHHFRVDGATSVLLGDLVEDNRNEDEIAVWIAKHNRYAVRQALQEHRERLRGDGHAPASPWGDADARVRWRKRVWRRLPLFVRPALYFTYRYVIRLGALDGRQGFIFHFLQGFWYRLLVDVNLDELRRGRVTEPVLEARAGLAPADDRGRA